MAKTSGGQVSNLLREQRPTLLMVGTGEPLDAAIRKALDAKGLFVESCASLAVQRAVRVAAPDLVLLVGDAARDQGRRVLRLLANHPATSVIPVVVLSDEPSLDDKLIAFRHGAVGVVPRSASADEIAGRIAKLAIELPDRKGGAAGELGEASFEELMSLVRQELHSGILSVHSPGMETDGVRVVLGAGRPVAAALKEFVDRLKPHVSESESLRYSFHEAPGGRLQFLDLETKSGDLSVLDGRRVLVVDHDPGRADALTQELRDRGATVVVTDPAGESLARAQGLDPEIIVFDAATLDGPDFELVRRIRRDLRLRWASLLLVNWSEIWPDRSHAIDMEKFAHRVAPLVEQVTELRDLAERRDQFDTRLEITGPGRLLRTLIGVNRTLHATISHSRIMVEVDIAEGLIVGAVAHLPDNRNLEGLEALAALMAIGSGRVRVEQRPRPNVANIMAPVDDTLAQAAELPLPIKPSVYPGANRESDPPTGLTTKIPTAGVPDLGVAGPLTPLPESALTWDDPAEEERHPDLVETNPAAEAYQPDLSTPPHVETDEPTSSDLLGKTGRLAEATAPGGDLAEAAGKRAAELDALGEVSEPPMEIRDSMLEEPDEDDIETLPPTAGQPVAVELPPDPKPPIGVIPDLPISDFPVRVEPSAVKPEGLGARQESIPDKTEPMSLEPGWPVSTPPPPPTSRGPLYAVLGVLVVLSVGTATFFVMRSLGGTDPVTTHTGAEPENGSGESEGSEPENSENGTPANRASEPSTSETGTSETGTTETGTTASGTAETASDSEHGAPEEVETGDRETTEGSDAEDSDPEHRDPEHRDPEHRDPEDRDPEAAGTEEDPDEASEAAETTETEVATIDPNRSASSLIREAERMVRDGRTLEAAPLFERALELAPNDNHVLAGMAEVHLARGEAAEAVEYAQRAVALRSRRASYRVILAEALLGSGNRQEARGHLQRAIQLDPGNARASRLRARIEAE
ncbi:MAG: tetratricopeptide repeat protein [Myxococcota bacterium]